jgi:iron(III) transport system ATP-binding protein
VRDVSAALHEGEILALVGHSGSGKSTTLRMIAGFEQPDAGTIELEGRRVADPDTQYAVEDRGIGMVFQEHALFPHLDVQDNVAFGISRWEKAARRARVRELLVLVGLEGAEHRYPHELSGGQLQRVALARALAPAPKMVLLDEPFNNLDSAMRLRLVREVRSILKQTGTASVFVTHQRDETFAMADRIAFLREGALEQVGTPREVYAAPASRFVAEFFGPINVIPAAVIRNRIQTAFGPVAAQAPRADNGSGVCSCELLVRPHEIEVYEAETSEDDALAISGTVSHCMFHGEFHELAVEPDTGQMGEKSQEIRPPLPEHITVHLRGSCPWQSGDRVHLRIRSQVIACACRPELQGRRSQPRQSSGPRRLPSIESIKHIKHRVAGTKRA